MVEAIWRLFCSLKLAGAIAAGLVAAIAAGVLLDRREIFQSWWFALALLGLALSVIACSLERGRPAWWLVSFPVLVMLAGGIAGSFVDFEGTIVIRQGGVSDMMTVRSPAGDWKRKLGFVLGFDGPENVLIFERLPDGSVGRPVARRIVGPDHASEYGGLRLSRAGFEEIRIAHNPSLPIVILGGVLLVVSAIGLAARLLIFGER